MFARKALPVQVVKTSRLSYEYAYIIAVTHLCPFVLVFKA
jgi:hypothetical protein